jgi:hypothetical protein
MVPPAIPTPGRPRASAPVRAASRCGGATVCVRGYSEPTMGSDLVCGPPVSPRRLVVQWFTPPDRLGGRGPGGAGAPGGEPGVCVRGLTGPTLSSDLVCGPSMSPSRPAVQWFSPPEQFALCDWGAAGSPSGVGPGCVRGQTGATLSSDLVCGSSWSPSRPAVQWFRPPEQFGVCGRGGARVHVRARAPPGSAANSSLGHEPSALRTETSGVSLGHKGFEWPRGHGRGRVRCTGAATEK